MSRLIDADALIDILADRLMEAERYGVDSAVAGVISGVMKLVEVQPTIEQPHWIPSSERLPEPRMAVLGYAPRYKNIYALYYDSAKGWMVWSPTRDDYFPNSQGEIIAWMPLPEPYKESEE